MSWIPSIEINWHAWEALATTTLIAVGLWQVIGIRNEAMKERTLNACNAYDTDALLDMSLRSLRNAKYKDGWAVKPRDYRSDVTTLLNYLDGIAIGIAQGIYIESLARDHLEHIVTEHCNDYLNREAATAMDFRLSDYSHLDGLWKSRTNHQPYYKDGWRLWKRGK